MVGSRIKTSKLSSFTAMLGLSHEPEPVKAPALSDLKNGGGGFGGHGANDDSDTSSSSSSDDDSDDDDSDGGGDSTAKFLQKIQPNRASGLTKPNGAPLAVKSKAAEDSGSTSASSSDTSSDADSNSDSDAEPSSAAHKAALDKQLADEAGSHAVNGHAAGDQEEAEAEDEEMADAPEEPDEEPEEPEAPEEAEEPEEADQSFAMSARTNGTNGDATTTTTTATAAAAATSAADAASFAAEGFQLRRATQELDASDVARVFRQAKLEGKQLWYFTAPASVPVTVVEKLAIPVNGARSGQAVVHHAGQDYGMNFDDALTTKMIKVLIPNKAGDKYSMLDRGVDQTMHLKRITQFAQPDSDRDDTAPSVLPPPQPVAKKAPRAQPANLKNRNVPFGVRPVSTTAIPPPTVGAAAAASLPAPTTPAATAAAATSSGKKRKLQDGAAPLAPVTPKPQPPQPQAAKTPADDAEPAAPSTKKAKKAADKAEKKAAAATAAAAAAAAAGVRSTTAIAPPAIPPQAFAPAKPAVTPVPPPSILKKTPGTANGTAKKTSVVLPPVVPTHTPTTAPTTTATSAAADAGPVLPSSQGSSFSQMVLDTPSRVVGSADDVAAAKRKEKREKKEKKKAQEAAAAAAATATPSVEAATPAEPASEAAKKEKKKRERKEKKDKKDKTGVEAASTPGSTAPKKVTPVPVPNIAH